MKLDTQALRYLSAEDWRVLAAVEQGSKNHELVPTPLIQQIAGLRGSNSVHRCISNLAKVGLIAKMKNARYDGYRLTYGGLDYLALNAYRRANTITSLGNQIGVGKESDIFVCADPTSRKLVLKLHRLGRISFRTVKANRDYLRNRSTGSWMYLSRLAAQKEHAFMRVLHREGFPVPEPVSWSRHTLVMEFIDAFPLRMIDSVPEPGKLYAELMAMIVQLAQRGLIHGDFNEFNILIKEHVKNESKPEDVELTPILIDFPQTLSTNHTNAEFYFDRDVDCVKRYFERRFKYTSDEPGPYFKEATTGINPEKRLDVEVEATGFSRKLAKELDRFVEGGDQGTKDAEEQTEGHASDDSVDEQQDEEVDDDDAAREEELGSPPPEDVGLANYDPRAPVDGDLNLQELTIQDVGESDTEHNLQSQVEARQSGATTAKTRTKKKSAGWSI